MTACKNQFAEIPAGNVDDDGKATWHCHARYLAKIDDAKAIYMKVLRAGGSNEKELGEEWIASKAEFCPSVEIDAGNKNNRYATGGGSCADDRRNRRSTTFPPIQASITMKRGVTIDDDAVNAAITGGTFVVTVVIDGVELSATVTEEVSVATVVVTNDGNIATSDGINPVDGAADGTTLDAGESTDIVSIDKSSATSTSADATFLITVATLLAIFKL